MRAVDLVLDIKIAAKVLTAAPIVPQDGHDEVLP